MKLAQVVCFILGAILVHIHTVVKFSSLNVSDNPDYIIRNSIKKGIFDRHHTRREIITVGSSIPGIVNCPVESISFDAINSVRLISWPQNSSATAEIAVF